MGSCISKCMPKTSSSLHQQLEDCDHVKHYPIISPAKKPVMMSPSPSSASFSSSSCSSATNSGYSLTASFSSSSSSSCSSKDKSFSNEFLKSCANENQHVFVMIPTNGNLGLPNSLRQPQNLGPVFSKPHKLAHECRFNQTSPRTKVGEGSSTPKKRPRSNSPTLVRQKSFRKDHESVNSPTTIPSTCHFPNRALRSPSPTRRFAADGKGKTDFSTFRHGGVLKGNSVKSPATGVRKENFKPASPNCQPRRVEGCSKGNTVNSQKGNIVNSKSGEVGNGEVQSSQEIDSMLIEDINNPLIALDCFIFL